MSEVLRNPIKIRPDSIACPLALSGDTYWGCPYSCPYCFTKLLEPLGGRFRPTSLERFRQSLENSTNSQIKSAYEHRMMMRLGNKFDPLPPQEREIRITAKILKYLNDIDYPFVLETKSPLIVEEPYISLVSKVHYGIPVFMGNPLNWKLEPRLPKVRERVKIIQTLREIGIDVSVNGEPVLPGYVNRHDAETYLNLLAEAGVKKFNFYNFVERDTILSRLHKMGYNVLRIHELNRDEKWREWGKKFIELARDYGFKLGVPDFVNFPGENDFDTCCGFNAENRNRFTFLEWIRIAKEKGYLEWSDVEKTYEGVGDLEKVRSLWEKPNPKEYGFWDIPIWRYNREKDRWEVIV